MNRLNRRIQVDRDVIVVVEVENGAEERKVEKEREILQDVEVEVHDIHAEVVVLEDEDDLDLDHQVIIIAVVIAVEVQVVEEIDAVLVLFVVHDVQQVQNIVDENGVDELL